MSCQIAKTRSDFRIKAVHMEQRFLLISVTYHVFVPIHFEGNGIFQGRKASVYAHWLYSPEYGLHGHKSIQLCWFSAAGPVPQPSQSHTVKTFSTLSPRSYGDVITS